MVVVKAVPAELTFPLRQRVLRPHQGVEELAAPSDGAPDSATFAALDDAGRVVGAGAVHRNGPPWDADGPGWQIRGMAVEPGHQGRGIGAALLDALVDHVARHGGGPTWCNARTPAVGLYRKAGFAPVGQPFDLPHIGPHVVMTRKVPPR